ncbi:MAG: hypothetical protein E7231_03205 [Cellulosilyticum sp.]|nr:hypothetical protein [Cellulosilyticum sp.]
MRKNYNISVPLINNGLTGENKALRNKLSDMESKVTDLQKKIKVMEEQYEDYFIIKANLEAAEYYVKQLESELIKRRKAEGRPERFSIAEKEVIRECRMRGMSINQLAIEFDCSVSTIHRLTKDIDVDLRKKG